MLHKIAFATALAVLAAAPASWAFSTPPLSGQTSGYRWLTCRVVNTDIVPHDVTLKIVQANTGVVKAAESFTLPPGRGNAVEVGSDFVGACDVTGISKSLSRTSFCVEDNMSNCLSVVAVP